MKTFAYRSNTGGGKVFAFFVILFLGGAVAGYFFYYIPGLEAKSNRTIEKKTDNGNAGESTNGKNGKTEENVTGKTDDKTSKSVIPKYKTLKQILDAADNYYRNAKDSKKNAIIKKPKDIDKLELSMKYYNKALELYRMAIEKGVDDVEELEQIELLIPYIPKVTKKLNEQIKIVAKGNEFYKTAYEYWKNAKPDNPDFVKNSKSALKNFAEALKQYKKAQDKGVKIDKIIVDIQRKSFGIRKGMPN